MYAQALKSQKIYSSIPKNSCLLSAKRTVEMSGSLTVRLLLIVACTLATLTDCARPLEDDELSTVILRLLETSQRISPHHLPPPQLSPAHRADKMFTSYRKPPSPIVNEEYKFTPDSTSKSREESLKASPRVEFDRNVEKLQQRQRQYTYYSVLHKNPAGPNPIGNEYRPGNTIHNVKKYRCPPPQG